VKTQFVEVTDRIFYGKFLVCRLARCFARRIFRPIGAKPAKCRGFALSGNHVFLTDMFGLGRRGVAALPADIEHKTYIDVDGLLDDGWTVD
jgi:hypothetical protein